MPADNQFRPVQPTSTDDPVLAQFRPEARPDEERLPEAQRANDRLRTESFDARTSKPGATPTMEETTRLSREAMFNAYRTEKDHGFAFAVPQYKKAVELADSINQQLVLTELAAIKNKPPEQRPQFGGKPSPSREDILRAAVMAPAATRINFALACLRSGEPESKEFAKQLLDQATTLRPELKDEKRLNESIANALKQAEEKQKQKPTDAQKPAVDTKPVGQPEATDNYGMYGPTARDKQTDAAKMIDRRPYTERTNLVIPPPPDFGPFYAARKDIPAPPRRTDGTPPRTDGTPPKKDVPPSGRDSKKESDDLWKWILGAGAGAALAGAAYKKHQADKKAAEEKAAAEKAGETKPPVEKTEAEKEAERKAAEEKAPTEKTEAEKEAERKAAEEKAAADKLAAETKAAEEKAAADKLAAETKAAEEKAAADKLAAEQKATEEKAAADKLAAEQKAADEKAAADKVAAEQKAAEEKAAADKLAAEQKAAEEKAAADKLAAEQKAAEEKAAADKLAAEQKAAEEKAAADKLAAEQKAAEEKAAADKLAAEQKAAEEKAAADKLAAEQKAAQEKVAAEKVAAEQKAAEEKAAAEKVAAEQKAAEEKAAAEKAEAARKAETPAKPAEEGRRRTDGRNRGPADGPVAIEDRGKVETRGDATFVTDKVPTAEVQALLDKWKGEEVLEKDLQKAVRKVQKEQRGQLNEQVEKLAAMEEGPAKDAVKRAMAEMIVEARKPGFKWDSAVGRVVKAGGAAGVVVAVGMLVQVLMQNEPGYSNGFRGNTATPDFGGGS